MFIGVIAIILLLLVLLWFMSVTVHKGLKNLGQFFSRNPEIALVALLSLVVIFYLFNEAILQDTFEEFFSLTEGVSVWPTVILRLVAIGLSWFFIFTSVASLRKSDHKLAKEFGLRCDSDEPANGSPPPYRHNLQLWWPTRKSQYQKLRNRSGKRDQQSLGYEKTVNETSPKEVGRFRKHYQEIRRDWEADHDQDEVRVDRAWEEYRSRWSLRLRLKRIIPLVIIYCGVCGLIIILFGGVSAPVRGTISPIINYIILAAAIISFLVLTFFVFDATSLCRRFVTRFLGKAPQWNLESLELFRRRVGLEEAELGDWMLIRLIAQRTEVVGNLIFYPFIVLFVMVVSRLRYFSNWHTPIGLAVVISMSAVLAWSCAFMLRRAAEKLRANVLERLAIGTHGAKPLGKEYAGRIQDLLKEINSIQRGAFAPYLQSPVVHSLLVPLGGFGGVQLFEMLGKLT